MNYLKRSQYKVILAFACTIAGVTAGIVTAHTPLAIAQVTTESTTNRTFPDVQDHWAQPFIQALTEGGIIRGYPDGTFRQEQPVARDEFAAILRQAFNQPQERTIASGSVYQDVPEGYWAAPAIEEAYEAGFMQGYPGGFFRPNQTVTKTEALVALARNLNLRPVDAANGAVTTADTPAPSPEAESPATDAGVTPPEPTAAAPENTPAQSTPSRATPSRRANRRRPLLFGLAGTAMLDPLVRAISAQAAPASPAPGETTPSASDSPAPSPNGADATSPQASPDTASEPGVVPVPASDPLLTGRPASELLTNYYSDAGNIPDYAIADVAETTKAGIVVNYPDLNLLNPTQPATRAEITALVHQALVNQG